MKNRAVSTTRTSQKLQMAAGAIAIAAALLAGLTPAASASATVADPSDPAVQAAIQRTLDGTWSQSDVDLILTNPDLAATLPDPRKAPTTVVKSADLNESGQPVDPANGEPLPPEQAAEFEPSPTADASITDREMLPAEPGATSTGIAPRITGGTWRTTHVIHTHWSYLGDVIYKYHHWATFNYGGGKVRAWGSRSDDVTNEVDWVDVRERMSNQATSAYQTSYATSYMKRKIAHCYVGNIACAYTYPWVKTRVNGNGTVSFTTGS
ncbi:hypothetical protein [Streptomyces sp. NPDC056399]|uniref:hypothetical protein n=1 Tax=Streptomyces sp. NPDC056399 TaxID=3345807 RepID=UPI0035D6C9D2